MKNRLRFRLIGVLIAIALACIVAFQGFWLRGLYTTLYSQMDMNIKEAMRLADYKELFYRMQELKEQNEEETREFSRHIQLGQQAEKTAVTPEEQNNNFFIQNDVNLDLQGIDLNTQIDQVLSELLHTLGNMEGIILQGMHDEVDPIIPVNFIRYDSLLVGELKDKHINTNYRLNLVRKMGDEETLSFLSARQHAEAETDSVAAALAWKEASFYDYPITLNKYARETFGDPAYYRLYIQSPATIVLHQMVGILASSFLVLVIIVITFIYLLRTIMRQKTEEELKTDFTNNMTHELKTPISVSYAAVDAILNFSDHVDEKHRKYLTIVEKQLTHLAGLVEQILTLSVGNRSSFKLRPEPVPFLQLVNQLIDQHRVKSGRDVHFNVEIPDNLILTADKTHLYNIMNNLVDNAIKYADKTPAEVSLRAEERADGVRVIVSDNGPGISAAHQSRIFDKFYRIPNGNLHNVKGHGLGLFYVKDIMKKHGGDVTVESQMGRGTEFGLFFKLL